MPFTIALVPPVNEEDRAHLMKQLRGLPTTSWVRKLSSVPLKHPDGGRAIETCECILQDTNTTRDPASFVSELRWSFVGDQTHRSVQLTTPIVSRFDGVNHESFSNMALGSLNVPLQRSSRHDGKPMWYDQEQIAQTIATIDSTLTNATTYTFDVEAPTTVTGREAWSSDGYHNGFSGYTSTITRVRYLY